MMIRITKNFTGTLYKCNLKFNEHYFTQDLLRLMVSSMPAHPGTFSVLTQRLECRGIEDGSPE